MIIVATFAQWLKIKEDQDSEAGKLARKWRDSEHGNASSPTGIIKWIEAHSGWEDKEHWIGLVRKAADLRIREATNDPGTPEASRFDLISRLDLIGMQLADLQLGQRRLLAAAGIMIDSDNAVPLPGWAPPDFGELYAMADLTAEGGDE